MFNRRHSAEALGRLHATFELNHARLGRLLPRTVAVDTQLHCQLSSGSVTLTLTERAPYSDVVTVALTSEGPEWIPAVRLQVRRYHDAGMSEVIDWCGERTVPWQLVERPLQLARDEKMQWNSFLAELLAQMSIHGRSQLAARGSHGTAQP